MAGGADSGQSQEWQAGATYGTGNIVAGSDGGVYVSLLDGNHGHDPTTDGGAHWKAGGGGGVTPPVTITGTDLSGPVLTLDQYADPGFVGTPALQLKAEAVSANLLETLDQNGNVMVALHGNTGVFYLFDSSGNLVGRLGGTSGLIVGAVNLPPSGGGLSVVPYLPGADGGDALQLDGSALVPADGSALININAPCAEMPTSFSVTNSMGINFLLGAGAASLALRGKDDAGTVIGALLPLLPGRHLATRIHAAPADGDLAAGDCAFWFDQTNGAGRLNIKAKTADATVVVGQVTLAPTVRFTTDTAGHLISTSSGTPATSNLGANVSSATFTGNDVRGTITIVMSAGLAANTRVCTATFATTYGAIAPKVTLVDQTSTAGLAIVNSYVMAGATGAAFDIAFDQPLVAGTYTIDYIVIG